MANIETKVTEGQDNEGRVILSCEVWTDCEEEHYAEVVYYNYSDEYKVVFGSVTNGMYDAAVDAIRGYQA